MSKSSSPRTGDRKRSFQRTRACWSFRLFHSAVIVTALLPAVCAGDSGNIQGVCVAYCGSPAPTPSGPQGPTPQQIRDARDAKDTREAADYAMDKGIAAYESGDFNAALKWFGEAHGYAPDDTDISANFSKEERKVREVEAARKTEDARKITSVADHSNTAGRRVRRGCVLFERTRSVRFKENPRHYRLGERKETCQKADRIAQ
jgi:hypothetical protein